MLVKRGQTYYTRLMFNGRLYQRSPKTRKKDDAVKYEEAFRTSLVKGEFGVGNGRDSPTPGPI
jgi:hypothetical protein